MGDRRRFKAFATSIRKNFPPKRFPRVADVAGGRAELQMELRRMGYDAVTYEPRRKRNRNGANVHRRLFSRGERERFDLLVGLHPDEATDVILVEAARRRVPFGICPCCVKPVAIKYNGSHEFQDWVKHLKRQAMMVRFDVTEALLPIEGKNLVLYGRPRR
jgi:hypothetical protein